MSFDFDKHIKNDIPLMDDPSYEITISYQYDRPFDISKYKNSPWVITPKNDELCITFLCTNINNNLIRNVVSELKKIQSYISDYGNIAQISCLITNIDLELAPVSINGYDLYELYDICKYLMFQNFKNIQLCHLPNPYDIMAERICYITFKNCDIRYLLIDHYLYKNAFYDRECNIKCMSWYYRDSKLYSRLFEKPKRFAIDYYEKEHFDNINELLTFMP